MKILIALGIAALAAFAGETSAKKGGGSGGGEAKASAPDAAAKAALAPQLEQAQAALAYGDVNLVLMWLVRAHAAGVQQDEIVKSASEALVELRSPKKRQYLPLWSDPFEVGEPQIVNLGDKRASAKWPAIEIDPRALENLQAYADFMEGYQVPSMSAPRCRLVESQTVPVDLFAMGNTAELGDYMAFLAPRKRIKPDATMTGQYVTPPMGVMSTGMEQVGDLLFYRTRAEKPEIGRRPHAAVTRFWILVEQAGQCRLSLDADDGGCLFIDGHPAIMKMDAKLAAKTLRSEASVRVQGDPDTGIFLASGLHSVEIYAYDKGGEDNEWRLRTLFEQQDEKGRWGKWSPKLFLETK